MTTHEYKHLGFIMVGDCETAGKKSDTKIEVHFRLYFLEVEVKD